MNERRIYFCTLYWQTVTWLKQGESGYKRFAMTALENGRLPAGNTRHSEMKEGNRKDCQGNGMQRGGVKGIVRFAPVFISRVGI